MRWASTLLLALLLAAGCRGGGDSKPLTRDQYAAKADAICAKYKQQLKVPRVSSMSELAASIDKTSPVLAKALDEIRKLKPPANEQATVDGWLAQVENLEGDLKEIRDKAKSNDMPGVLNGLSKATSHNAKSRQRATQLGMKVCNEDEE